MSEKIVLELMKARLGITGNIRDKYMLMIINGIISELTSIHGIALDGKRSDCIMLVVDYAVYRYQNKDEPNAPLHMPRHIQWRLHNLFLSR